MNIDAPFSLEEMLGAFLTEFRPAESKTYIRDQNGSFSHFVDPELHTLWIGFCVGRQSREPAAPHRPACDTDVPTLFCIGEYLTALGDSQSSARWRQDGRVVKAACRQIIQARRQLLDTLWWTAGRPEYRAIQGIIQGVLHQLGAAVDIPAFDDAADDWDCGCPKPLQEGKRTCSNCGGVVSHKGNG